MALETNTTSSNELQGVARRLDGLETQISAAVRGSRTRNFVTLLLSILSIVLVGFWLYYAHLKFSQVNPDFAADLVQGYIEQNLPSATSQLEASLKQNAPSVIGEGEKQLHAMPAHLQANFHDRAQKALDEEMPQLQVRLYTTL